AAVDYILNKSLTRSQWRDLAVAGTVKYPASGKDIYNESCAICHNDGKQGAPKLGDKEAWKPLLNKNIDILVSNVLHDGAHAKNAGCKKCSTGELIEAIKYMVSQSKTEGN